MRVKTLLMLLFIVFTTSCNTNVSSNDKNIVGEWTMDAYYFNRESSFEQSKNFQWRIIFNSDGTYKRENNDSRDGYNSGTWKMFHNKVIEMTNGKGEIWSYEYICSGSRNRFDTVSSNFIKVYNRTN